MSHYLGRFGTITTISEQAWRHVTFSSSLSTPSMSSQPSQDITSIWSIGSLAHQQPRYGVTAHRALAVESSLATLMGPVACATSDFAVTGSIHAESRKDGLPGQREAGEKACSRPIAAFFSSFCNTLIENVATRHDGEPGGHHALQ